MLSWTVAAILYPVITPLHIISTVRGCPRHHEDREEETENQGKFMKLFDQFGKFILISFINSAYTLLLFFYFSDDISGEALPQLILK